MSIASKLKDLVIKWGGQPTKDDDSIEELIALLTELDAPSGGSDIMIVNAAYKNGVGSFDKTYSEIKAEMNAHKPVLVVDNSGRGAYMQTGVGDAVVAIFISAMLDGGTARWSVRMYGLNSSDEIMVRNGYISISND